PTHRDAAQHVEQSEGRPQQQAHLEVAERQVPLHRLDHHIDDRAVDVGDHEVDQEDPDDEPGPRQGFAGAVASLGGVIHVRSHRPRTRRATLLRWTSAAPPARVAARCARKKAVGMTACSGPTPGPPPTFRAWSWYA